MKRGIWLFVACMFLFVAVGLASAQSADAVQPRQITNRSLVVAFVPVTMNPAYTLSINGAKKEIEKLGNKMEFIVRAPTSNISTITDQGNILEDLVGRKVDAIALATEADQAMLPYLREATKANIPVFLFNMSTIDPADTYYVTSIGYDQYKAGFEIGAWVAKHYPQGNIGVLEGYPGVVNTQRMNGFKDAIKNTPGLKIVASQIANWNRADGQKVTESLLTAHPEINILYGDYDEMVLGGLAVVKERNLLNKIHLVGFGAEKAAIDAVANGTFVATVLVNEYGTGIDIIDAVYKFCVKGQPVPKVIYRDPVAIDASNLNTLDMTQYQ